MGIEQARRQVAIPDLSGPVSGGAKGRPFLSSSVALAPFAYVEEEFFIAGTARPFRPVGALESDGRWSVEPGEALSYKTRILVRRPADLSRANGTLAVEWLMSIPGFDVDPNWVWHHEEYLRGNYVWIGVSAKHASVDASASAAKFPHVDAAHAAAAAQKFKSLAEWDPERYGSLTIPAERPGAQPPPATAGRPVPGIELAFDIFQQAAMAAAERFGPQVAKRLLAVATTDGAAHLVTYYNALQKQTGLFDGYFLESRGVGNFSTGMMPFGRDIALPAHSVLRDDVAAPVLLVNQDYNVPYHSPYRQADNPHYRFWEVAGTAHMNDAFNTPLAAAIERDIGHTPESVCGGDHNIVPWQYVGHAALRRLVEWIDSGTAPASFPPIDVAGSGFEVQTDRHGNSRGGVRLPHLTVPIARHTVTNDGCTGTRFYSGPGSTLPFTAEQRAALYPTRDAYLQQFADAADAATKAGFLLPEDATAMVAAERTQAPAW